MAVKKFTLGLQPEKKVFRVDSMVGIIIDALLDARGKKISDTYYTQIAEGGVGGVISLLNSKEGNTLLVDRQNVVFTKSKYPNGHVNLEEAFSEFKKVWSVIQEVVKFDAIRRIGIVAEHRFDSAKNNNVDLLSSLTKLPTRDHPAHFSLHYEKRVPTKPAETLDVSKDCFTNCIYDFYDSALDTSAPENGKINANFDYQKYFSPSLSTRLTQEMDSHFHAFKKERLLFEDQLTKLGIKNDGH